MDKVKFGIIGVGNMGVGHLGFFNDGKIKNGVVTAVADISEKKREAVKASLPEKCVCYNSGEELIDKADVDVVIIAAPHYDHPPLAIRALKKGLNVICEKPAGVYTKQVKEMNAVAEKSKGLFTMMYNQRTNPLYKKLHAIIEGGELGELRRVNWIITNWFRTQFYYDSGSWRATWSGEGGGVLLNQCPHQMDLVTWICGLPSRVRAFCHVGKWHDIEVEDDVSAYWEYPNGATGVFVTSTGDAPGTNRFEVDLEKGKLVCEDDKLTLYRLSVNEREFCRTAKGGFDKPECTKEVIDIEGENPQHKAVINAFAAKILGHGELIAPGYEGINGLMLSNALFLSSWLDKTIEIPFDEDLFLAELNKRIAASKRKEDKNITFSTEGTY